MICQNYVRGEVGRPFGSQLRLHQSHERPDAGQGRSRGLGGTRQALPALMTPPWARAESRGPGWTAFPHIPLGQTKQGKQAGAGAGQEREELKDEKYRGKKQGTEGTEGHPTPARLCQRIVLPLRNDSVLTTASRKPTCPFCFIRIIANILQSKCSMNIIWMNLFLLLMFPNETF